MVITSVNEWTIMITDKKIVNTCIIIIYNVLYQEYIIPSIRSVMLKYVENSFVASMTCMKLNRWS